MERRLIGRSMDYQKRALQLIERIYEAAIEPDAWSAFVEDLSAAFGGAGVAMSVQSPGNPYDNVARIGIYRSGLADEFGPVYYRHLKRGLPWGDFKHDPEYLSRFVLASETFPDDKVPETLFYKEFMEPQGLAPEAPIGHVVHVDEETFEASGLGIYRRVGARRFAAEDLLMGDMLVPHLARAFEIHRELSGRVRERDALTEVVDRLPTGVVLLDCRRRPVFTNRTALEIAARNDGLRLDDDSPRLWNPQENTLLRKLIDGAIESCLKEGMPSAQVMSISRPSGKRPFVALVSSLLRPNDVTPRDSVAAIFVGDAADVKLSTREILEGLYSLTRAEAELVELLVVGHSLDEAASARGITMNTARSQLKQVFAKTDTKRQGELVQLVLSGVATIHPH